MHEVYVKNKSVVLIALPMQNSAKFSCNYAWQLETMTRSSNAPCSLCEIEMRSERVKGGGCRTRSVYVKKKWIIWGNNVDFSFQIQFLSLVFMWNSNRNILVTQNIPLWDFCIIYYGFSQLLEYPSVLICSQTFVMGNQTTLFVWIQ